MIQNQETLPVLMVPEKLFTRLVSDADSGYFMATKDVNPGTQNYVWWCQYKLLRIADKAGNGFVEAFPEAQEFDPSH